MPDVTLGDIRVVHTEKDFLVIEKPAGIPSSEELYPEGFLVHRIDTATQGLLLFAHNADAYAYFVQEQAAGRFTKHYTAHCDIAPNNAEKTSGFPPQRFLEKTAFTDSLFSARPHERLVVQSTFRPWGAGRKEVRPVSSECGHFAQKKGGKTVYETTIDFAADFTASGKNMLDKKRVLTVGCFLTRGFRHQVRCHLAWLGLPVVNDVLYNYAFRSGMQRTPEADLPQMQFFADALIFHHPATGELTKICVNG
ncbi:MAG: hypothetical protein Ta2A_16050 [Treponemataceae bacterium]|nr:MAG: hypothetical protein Ta2A_16050 [Treponemataceae bacterium]